MNPKSTMTTNTKEPRRPGAAVEMAIQTERSAVSFTVQTMQQHGGRNINKSAPSPA